MTSEPLLSVVIPVYMTEPYLRECLDSVLGQTLQAWEAVVVNDGSPDGSAAIIDQYAARDPRVRAIHQTNAGHAAARNRGIEEARGEYITFLDSDDLLPAEAFETLVSTAQRTDADIVTGIAESFSSSRRWVNAQMQELRSAAGPATTLAFSPVLARDASPCNKIIRRSIVVEHDIRFPHGIPVREDLHFVLRCYARTDRVTIIEDIVYDYRLREDEENPSHTQVVSDAVMSGLVRVEEELSAALDGQTTDEIIEEMRFGVLGNVVYRLSRYLGGEPDTAVVERIEAWLRERVSLDLDARLDGAHDRLVLALLRAGLRDLAFDLCRDGLDTVFLARAEIDGAFDHATVARLIAEYQSRWIRRLRDQVQSAPPAKLPDRLKRSGKALPGKVRKKLGLPSPQAVGREVKLGLARASRLSPTSPSRRSREIWLVGERRGLSAEDTGFALFRYLRENRRDIEAYFVTRDNAKFVEEARELGNVVKYGSLESYRLLLEARVLAYSDSCKDFFHHWNRAAEMLRPDVVGCFLQHGVIGLHAMGTFYDYDAMLSRGERVDLFVSSSERERQLVTSLLGHPDENVVVTGLSRFDYLDAAPSGAKQILYMPTWRPWLRHRSVSDVARSDYMHEIQGLLADERLHALLEEHDCEFVFCAHFAMDRFSRIFRSSHERVSVVRASESRIQDLIRGAALMVSDYSSVTHDFAYQGRPVIYWGFDRERFYDLRGPLLDLEADLPGELVTTRDELLDELGRAIEGDFSVSEEHQARARKLFAHQDDQNCERIIAAIRARIDGASV